MTIYLYVKTHQKTGLKYLGKTTQDPFTYLGSGVDWKLHLKEHGKEHSTKIIKECKTNSELSYWGRYYSELWNVAKSTEWANRIPETGGGLCGPKAAQKGHHEREHFVRAEGRCGARHSTQDQSVFCHGDARGRCVLSKAGGKALPAGAKSPKP